MHKNVNMSFKKWCLVMDGGGGGNQHFADKSAKIGAFYFFLPLFSEPMGTWMGVQLRSSL